MEFWKRINEEKDKNVNSGILPSKRDQNVQGRKKNGQWAGLCDFFKERAPSL